MNELVRLLLTSSQVANGTRDGIRRYPARLDARLCDYAMEVDVKDKTWRFSQRAAATAVSLLLGTAAQAGNVRGNLDPPGANGIPPYNGFAIFNVPCLNTASAGWHGTAGCGIVMESATIYLYSGGDGGAPNVPPGSASPAVLEDTLLFGTQSSSYIFGFLSDGDGHLLGLDSAFPAGGVFSSPFSKSFFLSFESGCADAPEGDPVCSPPVILLEFFAASIDSVTAADPQGILSDNSQPPNSSRTLPGGLTFENIDIAAVPEPGTVSLILGALGGGWLARRRKKKLAA